MANLSTNLLYLLPQKLSKSHPALIHAAENLMAAIHEEQMNRAKESGAALPSGGAAARGQPPTRRHGMLAALSYHLDSLSDDGEDEDDDGGDVDMEGNPLQR